MQNLWNLADAQDTDIDHVQQMAPHAGLDYQGRYLDRYGSIEAHGATFTDYGQEAECDKTEAEEQQDGVSFLELLAEMAPILKWAALLGGVGVAMAAWKHFI